MWLDKTKGFPNKMISLGYMTLVHPNLTNRDYFSEHLSTAIFEHGIKDEDKKHFPVQDNKLVPIVDIVPKIMSDPRNKKIKCTALAIRAPEPHKAIIYNAILTLQGLEGDNKVLPNGSQFIPHAVITEQPALYRNVIKQQIEFINGIKSLSLIGLSEAQLDTPFKCPEHNETTIRSLIQQHGMNLEITPASTSLGVYRLLFPKSLQAEKEKSIDNICNLIKKYHSTKAGNTAAVTSVRLTNDSAHKSSQALKSCIGQLEQAFGSNPQDDEEDFNIQGGYGTQTNSQSSSKGNRSYASTAKGQISSLTSQSNQPKAITAQQVQAMIDKTLTTKLAEHTIQMKEHASEAAKEAVNEAVKGISDIKQMLTMPPNDKGETINIMQYMQGREHYLDQFIIHSQGQFHSLETRFDSFSATYGPTTSPKRDTLSPSRVNTSTERPSTRPRPPPPPPGRPLDPQDIMETSFNLSVIEPTTGGDTNHKDGHGEAHRLAK